MGESVKFSRAWAMPNAETFSIKPIGEFVTRWMTATPGISIDPFARNKQIATLTNDLNPETSAACHMDASEFCRQLIASGVTIQIALFDPPYSPRQISEVYKGIGREVTMQDTQSSFWKIARDALDPLIVKGGICLSFGWSSNGMGKTRGYEIEEILLVAHGGAHNDTICMAERKL